MNYTYDAAGRLTQVQDPTGTYSFTYDNMNRLTQATTDYARQHRSLHCAVQLRRGGLARSSRFLGTGEAHARYWRAIWCSLRHRE